MQDDAAFHTNHSEHFLIRLDRITCEQTERALALYRDPSRLRFCLANVRLPEGDGRVAISLDDPVEGPFVVVTREGHFVTCLGRGMGTDGLHVIPRSQFDALSSRVETFRGRFEAARRLSSDGNSPAALFEKVVKSGATLSREEFDALLGLVPLARNEFARIHSSLCESIDEIGTLLRERMRVAKHTHALDEALHTYWNTAWAIGHTTALLAVDAHDATDESLDGASPTFSSGLLPIAMRGLWAAGRRGKQLVRAYHQVHRDPMASPARVEEASLALATIALRHAKLRTEASRSLQRAHRPIRWSDDELAALIADPERLAALFDADARARCFAQLQGRTAPASLRFESAEEVPTDLARAVVLNESVSWHDDAMSREGLLGAAAVVAGMDAQELYLPREWIRATARPWHRDDSLALLRAHAKAMRTLAPVRAVPQPGRNEQCNCGSGRKFKKCCAA